MGAPPKKPKAKTAVPLTATQLFSGGVESEARREGRRLILKFIGGNHPELDRIEFHWSQASEHFYWQQGDPPENHPMSWTKVPQALALIFLNYLSSGEQVGPVFFSDANTGGLATALGNAISDKDGRLHELFVERLGHGLPASRVKQVFSGKNVHGKEDQERRIFVRPDRLPPDCVEIFWVFHGPGRIIDLTILHNLARRIRQSLGMPDEPTLPTGEARESKTAEKQPEPAGQPPAEEPSPARKSDSSPKPATEPFQPELKAQQPPATGPGPVPQAGQSELSKLLAKELAQALDDLRKQPTTEPAPPASQPPPEKQAETPQAKEDSQKVDLAAGEDFLFELKDPTPAESEPPAPLEPPPAKIDPRLFEIQNPEEEEWDDFDGLINFGEENNDADIWRIRDSSEGVLIFGAVGSGKTSSTGSLIARQYLSAGYGGLVLTAKPDEAKRWLRLCEQTGRMGDCVHVTPHSAHKLNILQYETQRPGERVAVTDDLIGLFRCIVAVMSRSQRSGVRDDFWSNTTNGLMRSLFEIFLLSGEPLTMSRLVQFINCAPLEPTTPWRNIPYFGEIIIRAEQSAKNGTDADKNAFHTALEYWTKTFPATTEVTRSGFVTGFMAMASVLTGRGINEMLSAETNLTPEMILSGKVVILDFPIKESEQGGNMVQAAWKLLFQQAIERRSDKGSNSARPVFLWEDEGHLFFSQHDVDFQPTARDCRASRVILSQNIHNFLHLGHNQHAVFAVFAAMNTYIFHTNGDHETNCWASERIGDLREKRLRSSGIVRGFTDKDNSFFSRRPEEVESAGGFSIEERRERAIPPEEFSKLKRGGDGTCEAVILWLSHKFSVNKNRNFCVRTFQQEPR